MDSRKRLRPWLWKHTDAGDFGLRWVNKKEGIFRIPWVHRSSRSWNKDHCQVLKEWAKFTMKYKDGDDEDYPGWKTRMRTALTKLNKDFEEIQDLHKLDDAVNPYKVYRFKCVDNQKDAYDSSMSPTYSPSTSDYMDRSPDSCSSSNTSPRSNVPQNGNAINGNIPNILELCEQDKSLKANNSTVIDQSYSPQIVEDCLEQEQGISNFEMPSLSNSQHCPSDLENLDSATLALSHELSSYELKNYKYDPTQVEVPISSSSQPDQPTMHYQLYYLDDVVKEGDLYNAKYHFHFGKIPDAEFSPDVFGPEDVERIELPDIADIKRSVNANQCKLMQNILLQMKRGFLLKCHEKDIYAQRLCRCRMFVTSPKNNNLVLDRQSKEPTKVFDLQYFKENHLDQNQKAPVAIITFAQELAIDSFKKLLMHVKLTSLEAKSLLPLPSTNHSSGLQLSDLNSGDHQLENMMNALSLEKK